MARSGPLLTEAQWKKIAPLLPRPPKQRKGGRPWIDKPSKMNEAAFQAAIDEVAAASSRLLHSLETNALPRNREEEAAKAKARAAARFGD